MPSNWRLKIFTFVAEHYAESPGKQLNLYKHEIKSTMLLPLSPSVSNFCPQSHLHIKFLLPNCHIKVSNAQGMSEGMVVGEGVVFKFTIDLYIIVQYSYYWNNWSTQLTLMAIHVYWGKCSGGRGSVQV